MKKMIILLTLAAVLTAGAYAITQRSVLPIVSWDGSVVSWSFPTAACNMPDGNNCPIILNPGAGFGRACAHGADGMVWMLVDVNSAEYWMPQWALTPTLCR